MTEPIGQKTPRTDSKGNDNTIFVGSKPLVNYIRGVITQFTKREASEVVIKSRGKFISKAVDVAEVARRSLEENIQIKEVKIGSESFESEGKKTNISTMDISLIKG
ncbi:MAG: DNA-binding protein Alba [archaeon]